MGIKEGTCDEDWMLDVSDESLNSAPETNFTICVNQNFSKNLKQENDQSTKQFSTES